MNGRNCTLFVVHPDCGEVVISALEDQGVCAVSLFMPELDGGVGVMRTGRYRDAYDALFALFPGAGAIALEGCGGYASPTFEELCHAVERDGGRLSSAAKVAREAFVTRADAARFKCLTQYEYANMNPIEISQRGRR